MYFFFFLKNAIFRWNRLFVEFVVNAVIKETLIIFSICNLELHAFVFFITLEIANYCKLFSITLLWMYLRFYLFWSKIFSWNFFHFIVFDCVTENNKKPFSSVCFTVKWFYFFSKSHIPVNPSIHHQIGKTQPTTTLPTTQTIAKSEQTHPPPFHWPLRSTYWRAKKKRKGKKKPLANHPSQPTILATIMF